MARALLKYQEIRRKIDALPPNFAGDTPMEELNKTIHLVFKLSHAIEVSPLDILAYIAKEVYNRSIIKT